MDFDKIEDTDEEIDDSSGITTVEKEPLRIVTWLWDDGPRPKNKIRFTPKHVNVMKNMINRHLHIPYEFCCITDIPIGIDDDVRIIPIWDDFRDMGGCYLRLKIFSEEMLEIIGPRFISIDLDAVLVDDITPIFDNDADFKIWGEHWRQSPYCGAMFMMDAGARADVYTSFRRRNYRKATDRSVKYGSDQHHINVCLYPNEQMWTQKDGVYNFNEVVRNWTKEGRSAATKDRAINSKFHEGEYRDTLKKNLGDDFKENMYIRKGMKGVGEMPDDARIIMFNGIHDPSKNKTRKLYKWIPDHWK